MSGGAHLRRHPICKPGSNTILDHLLPQSEKDSLTSNETCRPGHRPCPALEAIPRTDDVAVINGSDRWTFARLAQAVERLAAGPAASSIRRGKRVALHLRNGPEIAVACRACFRISAIAALPTAAHPF